MNQSQLSKSVLITACLVGMSGLATARAGTASYDFTTDPSTDQNLTIVGNNDQPWQAEGGNPGGFLAMTYPQDSMYVGVVFPDIDPGSVVTSFQFDCDLRVGNSEGDRGADGFSISFARSNDPLLESLPDSLSDQGNFAGDVPEAGATTGIAISFDTWSGNQLPDGADIEGIIVRVDNKTVLRAPRATRHGACDDATSLQTGPRDPDFWTDFGFDFIRSAESWDTLCWQPFSVVLTESGQLTVKWKGATILDNFQTTYFPSPGRLIFAGRTGGENEHTHVDNIRLTTTASSDSTPPSLPGNLRVASTTAGKVVLNWDAATDDSDRVAYNIERDGTVIAPLVSGTTYTDLAVLPGETYSYRIQAQDPTSNKSAFTAAVTATTLESNPVPTAGLLFEAWNGITGTAITLLTDDQRYIDNQPDVRALATAADTRTVYADDSHENYGGRLSGLLVPKESGSYEFFLRSDDASQLYLSTDTNTANLALIAEEIGCCAVFQETGDPRTSAPVDLVANRPLAIQIVWKEGGGGDYAQVAWRRAGDTTPAAALTPIPGEFFQTVWDPTIGLPAFTVRPRGTNAPLGGSVTLTAETIGDQPITYQWSVLGGGDIPGATNSSLTLNNFAVTNTGVYRVTAANVVGTASALVGVFPEGSLFIEAEDFNFDNGNFITNQPLAGPYRGDAYRGLGTEADQGIDYNADGNGAQLYREVTGVDAGKENQHPDGLLRGEFDVAVNTIVGWNDAGEWYNYTREFPAGTTNYNVVGRLASGDAPLNIQLDEVTSPANTANQTVRKLGQFRPGRATAGWDNYEFFPLTDDAGNLATITDWTGLKTVRVTYQPGGTGDMDYLIFVPAGGTGPSPGSGFTSVARDGNNLVLAWTTGTLESADAVTGPWTAVANAASPATIPIAGGTRFFRLR